MVVLIQGSRFPFYYPPDELYSPSKSCSLRWLWPDMGSAASVPHFLSYSFPEFGRKRYHSILNLVYIYLRRFRLLLMLTSRHTFSMFTGNTSSSSEARPKALHMRGERDVGWTSLGGGGGFTGSRDWSLTIVRSDNREKLCILCCGCRIGSFKHGSGRHGTMTR